MALPILYSLRNCPYAMRARLAIFKSQQPVALRDVVLTNKPAEMILASAKATVPILVLSKIVQANGKKGAEVTVKVIDESLDIMLWALNNSDPSDLLHSANPEILTQMLALIADFDVEFKRHLEAYKCAKRYHEDNLAACIFIFSTREFSRYSFVTFYSPICSYRASMVFAVALS